MTLARTSVILMLAAAACGGGSVPRDGGGGSGAAGTGNAGGSGTAGAGAFGGTGGASGSGGAAGEQGGTTGTGGAIGGRGGTMGTGGAGGTACGAVTCGGNQVCVHLTCGGGVQVCIPLGDAGQCPTGFVMTDHCSTGSGPGCVPPVCDPPPPRCVDVTAACSGKPTCGCLPSNVCQQPNGQFGGACANVSDGSVLCLSA